MLLGVPTLALFALDAPVVLLLFGSILMALVLIDLTVGSGRGDG